MSVVDLLMKNLGIDPSQINKNIEQAKEGYEKTVIHFNDRLDTIEKAIHNILAIIEVDREK